MTWYPKAVRKQLTVPNRAKHKVRMSNPVRINLHTAVSNGGSLFGFFNSKGANGVFSHFYVTKDGGVEQYQSIDFRAACDLDGNPDTISIETWDGYPRGYPNFWKNDSDVPPWNTEQLTAIRDLISWILLMRPSIPLKLATSNLRNGTASHGISSHRLGVIGAPGFIPRNRGGMQYSLAPGKVCPGPRRIAQIPGILATITTVAGHTQTSLERMVNNMSDDKLKALMRQAAEDALASFSWKPMVPDHDGIPGSSWRNNMLHQTNASMQTLAMVRKLMEGQGIKVDTTQMTKDFIEAVMPLLTEALIEEVGEEAASRTVDKLAGKLSGN